MADAIDAFLDTPESSLEQAGKLGAPVESSDSIDSFLDTPSPEEQTHIHGATQILQEVAAGKHPDMTEEELLPIVKLASRDPNTGKQTTPLSRAGHQAMNVLGLLANPTQAAGIGGELVKEAGTGVKHLYEEAQKADAAQPAWQKAIPLVNIATNQATKDAVVGGTGKTLQFLGDTLGNAATGTANLLTQAANSMTGQTLVDSDLTNTRSIIEQGQMNKGIEDTVRSTGANPDSAASELGGLIGQAAIPIGGEAGAAGKVAKTASAIVDNAPKAIGAVIEKGAQAAQNKYVQAATLTATGHPVAGLGVLAERGLENRFGSLGGWLMNTRRKIMDASLGKIEGLGSDLRAIPEGPYRDTLLQDAQSVIDKNNARLQSIATKEEIAPDAYVFQKHEDGSFVHPEEFLPKPEKEIRKIQIENANQAAKIDQINSVSDFTKVAGYASKLGLATAGNIGVGASIGGLIGGVNAQPGDDESSKRMAVMGAALSAPFAPFHASQALRDVRAEAGREAFKESGKDNIGPDHPNYEAHQEAYNGLNQQGKDAIDVANGMLKGMGGKGVVILPREEFIKAQGGDTSKTPSRGFVRDGTIYLNGESISQGVIGHELTHFLPQALGQSVFDIMPDLKGKMEGKETSQAYKDFENYYNSLSPDSTKTNIPEEVLAETGRRVLTDLPPELFYGGESGADVLKRWGGKILSKVAPEWYNKNQVDPILKAPISKADEAAVRAKLFEMGQRRGQEPPRNAPDEPPATTIPTDASKRATDPPVGPETPISAPPGAVEALTGLGEPKKSAQSKVDAATAEIQSEGVPVTLEEVVRRAIQKTVPAPIPTESTLSSASPPLVSSESLSQAMAPPEGRNDAAKAPLAPVPIEEIPKQSAPTSPDVPTKNIVASEDAKADTSGVSSEKEASRTQESTGLSDELVADYVNSEQNGSLADKLQFLIQNGVDDAQILRAARDNNPNFGKPELGAFKAKNQPAVEAGAAAIQRRLDNGEHVSPEVQRQFGMTQFGMEITPSLNSPMLVGPRTDKYGKKSVSGRIFDPELTEHAALAEKAGLDEANIAKLKELSDKMGETVGIDYSHAPEEGEGRKEAQKKTLAQARIEGAKREKLSKTFVPSWIEFTSGSGKAVVRGFSPDKFYENVKTVFDKYPEVMEGKYSGVNDPRITQDFQNYAENHANGYTGMGKPIEGTELTPVNAPEPGMVRLYHGGSESAGQAGRDFTPFREYAQGYADKSSDGKVWYVDIPEGTLKTHDEYGVPMSRVTVPDSIADRAKSIPKPHIIPEDRASVINLLMGDTSAADGIRKPSPVKLEKRALARANAPFFDESVGETNKIRAAKGSMGLEPVSETLRPELIDRIRDSRIADEHTIRPSGAAPETRASLAKAGTPNSTYVASGFMPSQIDTPQFKEWFGKSKVKDESGPIVVYKAMHPFDWTKESGEYKGPPINSINRTTEFPAFNHGEKGVKVAGFFGDKETSNRFSKGSMNSATYPVYLSLEKPYVVEATGKNAADIQFGATGKEWRDAMRSGKYDGSIIKNTEDEGTIYVAMKPEQIKSAIGNSGNFDPKNPDIAFMPDDFKGKTIEAGEPPWSIRLKELQDQEWQGKKKLTPAEEDELLTLHKKAREEYGSYANWFEKMGAEKDYTSGVFGDEKQQQFMPSPHIEREAERLGLQYKGDMGEGDRTIHLFNDPITKSTISIKADAEKGALQDKLRASREKFGAGDKTGFMPDDEKNLVALHNLSAEKLRHADRMGGLPLPSIAITRADKVPFTGFGDISLVGSPEMITPSRDMRVLNADAYSPRYPTVRHFLDAPSQKSLRDMVGAAIDATPKADKSFSRWSIGNEIEDRGIVEGLKNDANMQLAYLHETGQKVPKMSGEQSSDYYSIRKKFYDEKEMAKYQDWLEQRAEGLNAKEKIFNGFTNAGNRKYLEHNLDTVVRLMKKEFRDGEGFNYGAGSVRATAAKQFRSLKDIQKSRNDIVPEKEMSDIKDSANNELTALADEIMPLRESDISGFGRYDAFSDDLKALAEGGAKNWKYLREQYGDNYSEATTQMQAFLDKLRAMPTEYFEGKSKRAVGLHEFTGAVIPSGTDAKTIAMLEKRGLHVREYEKGNLESRRQAVEDLAREKHALFMPQSDTPIPEPKEPQSIKSLRVAQPPPKDEKAAPIDFKIGTKGSGYNTPLTAKEVIEFDKWKAKYAPKDSGKDYDLRGAFKAGLKPNANGHWPDTFKKPNHPTFSRESVYADATAGTWSGDVFVPAKKATKK